MIELREAVAGYFISRNGEHPMTPADDTYVTAYFATLDEVTAGRDETSDDLRRHILAGRLPLPGYLRSDGTEMVPPDYLRLPDEHGIDALPEVFGLEFLAYTSGRYVCLTSVTPANIRAKDRLVVAIETLTAAPKPDDAGWLAELHAAVDELDELEPPFTLYDRLRFGGPVSRDRCIDAVRRDYPGTTLSG
ncbi:DUF6058 family natural product biosynthesis protein [Phytomonospora endophytica]|uniref:Uncharacterized protein n=1 Tax=Phytomonospora endophytica TaxID=714109 RepID=A0A841FNP2_9ACTN|nr:DUF6058 family natural product biosynthesis protein [Phytomonospora endophytica]MBB6035418.1 hypothetical protein [Phytomonospora endophytica]GIG63830.1 hypothetical protein Pen01_01250 [Phytomonospora endophytica]